MDLWYAHPSVKKYINNLEEPTRAQVAQLLWLLIDRGHALGNPQSKYLGSKLHELRHRGKTNIRIFYTFYEGKIVVPDVIKKKTQKLRAQDLDKARQRLSRLQTL